MTTEISTADDLQYQFNPVTTGSLHFKVRSANDAHIALTSGPEESDPMYEIFIGGWSNSKSVVRRNRTKPEVAEAATADILSANEFRGFWIKWDSGSVTAGKEGEGEPFLSYTDPEPFGIGYYGICTGWGASGTWIVEGGPEEIATIDGGDCLTYAFHPLRHGSVELDVRTPSNAHISLTFGPRETDPMYEIILGGWENSSSVIRYKREKPDKVQVDTPGLLSQGEFRRFIIDWNNGRIAVTHKDKVLLAWTDLNPIGVSHIGVRTAWGASGHWRIQCADPRRHTRENADAEEELKEQHGEEEEKEGEGKEEEGGEGKEREVDGEATTQPGWNLPVSSGTGAGAGCWIKAANGEIPDGAVPGGNDGEQLYVARAEHEGAVIPGKLVPSHGVAYVPWGGGEHGKAEYEILCGCQATWVKCTDGELPPNAVPGGQTEDGEVLYVGRVEDDGKITVGKVQPSHKVCYIPYAGSEVSYPEYEVLVAN